MVILASSTRKLAQPNPDNLQSSHFDLFLTLSHFFASNLSIIRYYQHCASKRNIGPHNADVSYTSLPARGDQPPVSETILRLRRTTALAITAVAAAVGGSLVTKKGHELDTCNLQAYVIAQYQKPTWAN